MKTPLLHVLAGNLALSALALTVSCSCLCGENPAEVGALPSRPPGQAASGQPSEAWRFVVSGDSRNCGDVVMPAIAAGAKKDGAKFYWHLGDLRAIYDFDQDIKRIAERPQKPLRISGYHGLAWDDFIENQIVPFEAKDIPFYVGIGNHEVIPPKTREQFVIQFADWLDAPVLRNQRLEDNRKLQEELRKEKREDDRKSNRNDRQLKTYYHWKQGVVDFIYLDNASPEQFDDEQLNWFKRVLKNDGDDQSILTVVVGMHKALPWSVSCDHSMNESGEGQRSGEKVYEALLDLQKRNKKVYVLASHSHYVMSDIFQTDHWKNNVLDGWIVGTAGAERYPLPKAAVPANSRTNVYGYLLGTVDLKGKIRFDFTELKPGDIPKEVKERYTESWINEACFAGNRRAENKKSSEPPDYCKDPPAKTP
jgi:hypothetical protein